MDIEAKRKQAELAYKSKNYESALECSLELVPYCDPVAYYTCAVIYETVVKDLARAYYYFDRLRAEFGDFDAYNGCVRIILKLRENNRSLLAQDYCRAAIAKRHDGISYLLLGRVLEELCSPPDLKEAKRMYLNAAFRGTAWGMRRYAAIEYRCGSRVLGCVYHIIATLLFPLYRIVFGKRAMRMG